MAIETSINATERLSNIEHIVADDAWKGGISATRPIWGHMVALGIVYFVNAFIGYRDYKYEEKRLRGFYESEVAAQLGKAPARVSVSDLKAVAQKNPVLAKALGRNKANRLLEFGVSSIGLTIAFYATTAALATLAGAGIVATGFTLGTFAAGAAIGFGIFYPCEKLMEYGGRKLFGLHEPSLQHASRSPLLQRDLSGPSQVRFLAQMQGRVNSQDPTSFIRPEQVMTAFLAINPELNTVISSRYGAAFFELPPQTRAQVMQDMGQDIGVFQMTEDLNSRTVRAQEVAFAAFGQASGVNRLDSPRVTRLEQALETTRGKLAAAQEKIGTLAQQAKDKTTGAASTIGDKIKHCFGKSQVSGVVPENQTIANAAMIPMEGQIPIGSATQKLLAQRQAAQNQSMTVNVGA